MNSYKFLVLKTGMLIFTGFITFFTLAAFIPNQEKPTVYLIGDSTVDNGSGNKGLWGWGKFFPEFFDISKIDIRNYAQGGTSARTFYTGGIWDKKINKRGLWDTVSVKMKKGDYLIIQFGLNDQGSIYDTTRARSTLKGTGDDSLKIFNKVTHRDEVVHTFGWYTRQFVRLAKNKGVTVIILSSVPKNDWKDGKLIRGEAGYAESALQVAKEENAYAVDLNSLIADAYDMEGQEAVTQKYHILTDHVHTTEAGARLNASLVAKGIASLPHCNLKKYLNL